MGRPKGSRQSPETRAKISAGLRNRPVSEATRRKLSESNTGKSHTVEARDKMSEYWSGRPRNPETVAKQTATRVANLRARDPSSFIIFQGYRVLTAQYGHPLAGSNGQLREHRKVLFDAIGVGPHECHWNQWSACGQLSLEWDTGTLCADHLNEDKLDNRPENLVPSCCICNLNRTRSSWWTEYINFPTN